MSLPEAEAQLQNHLGTQYDDRDWRPALKAVMDAENDSIKALEAIRELSLACNLPKLTIRLPGRPNPQLANAETQLMEAVEELRERNRIFNMPTLEDLVNPAEEDEDLDCPSDGEFEGGDADIVAQVQWELEETDASDSEVENEGKGDADIVLSRAETMKLCEQLEQLSLKHGGENFSLKLPRQLRLFRAQLYREEFKNAKQVTLDTMWKK